MGTGNQAATWSYRHAHLQGVVLFTASLRFWAGLQCQKRKKLAKARSCWSQGGVQGMPRESKPPKSVYTLMCMP